MIDKISLKNQAYEILKDMIISKKLGGQEIYSVQYFAELLNISRTPIREAVLQLVQEGFLEIRPNRGVKIKPITREEMRNIFEMRKAIEGYCCAYLTKNRDLPSAASLIHELIELNVQNHGNHNGDLSIQNDLLFHSRIVSYAENVLFNQIYTNMCQRMNIFATASLKARGRDQIGYEEHLCILNAIQRGDETGARLACEHHLDVLYQSLWDSDLFDQQR